jgi:hypothetical protein
VVVGANQCRLAGAEHWFLVHAGVDLWDFCNNVNAKGYKITDKIHDKMCFFKHKTFSVEYFE